MKRAVSLKNLVILFITLAVSYHFYERLTFNIEDFMVHDIYNGDQETYQNAQLSGVLKYCDKYVFIDTGVSGTSIDTAHYRRISDGRLVYVAGQLCLNSFPGPDVRLFGYSLFDTKWKPLGCRPIRNLSCPENCPSLECAIRHGELGSAERLVSEGANPNEGLIYNKDWPLLIYAISKREYDIAKLLVKNGADVNKVAKAGRTAVNELSAQYTRNEDFLELFDILIDKGANINHSDERGFTALHRFIFNAKPNSADIAILEKYLEAGADPNLQNINGETVLNWYMSRISPKRPNNQQYRTIISRLLASGADPRIENEAGISAIDRAQEKGMDELVELMQGHPKRDQTE